MSFSNYWSMTNSILLSIVFFLFRYCGFMCNFWKRQLFWAFVLIVRIISQPRPLFCVPFIAKKRAGGEVVYITPQLHQYLCGRGWWVSVSVWVCVCVCVCVLKGGSFYFGNTFDRKGKGFRAKKWLTSSVKNLYARCTNPALFMISTWQLLTAG